MKQFLKYLIIYILGLVILAVWIHLTPIILVILFTACFIMSSLSLFSGNLRSVNTSLIRLLKLWLEIPHKMISAYDENSQSIKTAT